MRRGRVRPSFRISEHGHTKPTNGGLVGGSFGGGGGSSGGGGGGSVLAVTDGTTTVATTILDFTSGATVTDLGGGSAGVAIAGGGAMVPYYIPVDETFTVPLYSQALFSMTIEVDGILEVNGFLIGVD